MKKYGILTLISIIFFCKAPREKAELTILGTGITGNFYYFEGEINQDVTPYCGEASPETSSSEDTSSSSSSSEDVKRYNISSYYRFQFGEYIQLRYLYDQTRRNFSLTPSTTTTYTCNTIDFINCNSSGTATCETSDNIKCGGVYTFIFVGVINPIVFQAVNGKIDWTNGYSLSSDKKYTQKASLDFEMIDTAGNVLKGKVYCNSN